MHDKRYDKCYNNYMLVPLSKKNCFFSKMVTLFMSWISVVNEIGWKLSYFFIVSSRCQTYFFRFETLSQLSDGILNFFLFFLQISIHRWFALPLPIPRVQWGRHRTFPSQLRGFATLIFVMYHYLLNGGMS